MNQRVEDRAGRGQWAEPGAFEVAPGVHRLPLPLPMDGLRAVNVYVIETDDGLVLVDGGWAVEASRKVLESSLHQLGYGLRDIRRFLVTHMHRDHYTQAYVLSRELGIEVSLGLGDKGSMDLMHGVVKIERDPNLSRLEAAGAAPLAAAWRKFMPAERPSLDDYGMPDVWLDDDRTLALGGRTVDGALEAGIDTKHVWAVMCATFDVTEERR